MEVDPTGRKPNEPGAKLDQGKIAAALLGDFSLALLEVAKVCTFGAAKYSLRGWTQVPDGEFRYDNAAWRHLLVGVREDIDTESGLLHQAHYVWNVLASFELRLRRQEEGLREQNI